MSSSVFALTLKVSIKYPFFFSLIPASRSNRNPDKTITCRYFLRKAPYKHYYYFITSTHILFLPVFLLCVSSVLLDTKFTD